MLPTPPFCPRKLGGSYRRLKAATGGTSRPRSRSRGSVVEADGFVEIAEVGDVTIRRGAVTVDAHLGEDPLGDVHHDLGVLGEEVLGVLPALAELLTFVGEPRARLLDEVEVDADVE